MMSYDSLVSGLQAKSVLANIHASLVQHDGWLTKENYENYNFVLEDEGEDSGIFAIKGMKDQVFAIHKDKDAKDYMLLSYGVTYIEDKVFRNLLQDNLSTLVFENMMAIDWTGITPDSLLSYIGKNDKSIDLYPSLNRKLDDYRSNNSYAPFSNSLLKGETKKFVTDFYCYFIESILSFLKYGKQNVILGNFGEEWEQVKNEMFDTIYLDCTKRTNTLTEDLNNALLHLTDDGAIFVETNRGDGDYYFRKYVIDNSMLEAYFNNSIPPRHSIYIVRKKHVSNVYIETLQVNADSYVRNDYYQKTISLSILKDLNYSLNLSQIECILEYGEKGISTHNLLKPYSFIKHEDKEGHLFCYKDFAEDYESVIIKPTDLDIDKVKRCRKATSPVLIMSKEKTEPHIVYVEASESLPVFIPYSYMAFSLDENVLCPEYLYYLCQNGTWQSVIENCTDIFSGYAHSYIDPFGDVVDVTGEDIFLHESHIVPIPSLPIQRQKIEDARLLQKVMDDKNKAKEVLFNQKEWLNEAHIRNTKHRLTNDLFPLATGVDLLHSYLKKSSGCIQKDDKISKITGLTVGSLIENMLVSIKTIEKTISDFTIVRKYTDTSKICISEFLRNYCENLSQKYSVPFIVETKGLDVCAKIEISHIALTDMLDNIVGNAVRHGFVMEEHNEYVISFEMEITNNGMCRLSISNNGKPMSERAKNIYFERGAFAGPTGHSGIGGAIIKDVCDQFNGNVFISENEKYPVVIVVEFPVLNF